MNPLISISDLIYHSWSFFKADWKKITARNAWLVPVMIVYFVLYFAGFATGRFWLNAIGLLILLVGSILVRLHVFHYLLGQDAPTTTLATQGKSLSQLFLPALLIAIVTGLGILGGSILLLLPGIWFAIAAGFGIFVYLEEGLTGTAAIGRSMELVKGRWWKTLWRLVIPAIVVQLVIGIISMLTIIVPVILAAVGGAGAMMALSEGGSGRLVGASLPILIIAGILFIAAILVNLFLSLISMGVIEVIYTKLFHSLKASR